MSNIHVSNVLESKMFPAAISFPRIAHTLESLNYSHSRRGHWRFRDFGRLRSAGCNDQPSAPSKETDSLF